MEPTAAMPASTAAIAGLLAGVAQVAAEHPLDTLKVRMQTLARPDLRALDDGAVGVLRATLQREGVAALYLGVYPRLLTYGFVKMSLFSLYERLRRTSLSPAVAGTLAGLANSVVSCAPELVKAQCQVAIAQGSGPRFGFAQTMAKVVAERGARGLLIGLAPLALRDTIGYAFLFSVYEKRHAYPQLPTALVGGLAGCSFYLVSLPADRVRTVIMTQSLSRPAFRSAIEAARTIAAQEGLRGFYRGLAPTFCRTFVGQAIALTIYDRVTTTLVSGRG
ncbi:mitochondrial carrier domain-containing protein [Pavlovales sp. CCMP2436]|nr:mitochondrial carrier domain-containing protein [Pavlovales sp. CCMP2436]